MIRLSRQLPCAFAVALGLLLPERAHAASLQPVANWGASGVPSTASMFIYVPDQLAAKPPILVLSHYCGGTASAVFGQAQGGGIVSAANQHGFIIVVPQTSNNCWDVGSAKALTRDGGGDPHAIAQMVKYALTTYQGNPERVYATGDSSGGMMTEALLALYPDIFKAGSAFAGVPATCWGAGNPDGSWSNQCAGGMVTHTPEEWGKLVRDMNPAYSGHRPRVQLFHGDADAIINFKNHTEAVKQWTNVLGLPASPTSTATVTLGSHQAKREQWKNACGYVVLDAFTSMGGDHGPSDALFNASFVVPFFGLDQTGETDPELQQCGMGGTGGMGGGAGSGGSAGTAGAAAGNGAGGNAGTGGVMTGGAGSAGAFGGDGGMLATGGTAGTGGAAAAGGAATNGGATGLGGTGTAGTLGGVGAGGAGTGSGGATAAGAGAGGSGATPPAGGSPGAAGRGGVNATGGSGAEAPPDPGGCSCRIGAREDASARWLVLVLGAALLRRRRDARA